jgi:hypothetical protein
MKFSAATILAAAAAGVSGAAFEVKDFSASCIPHSTFCEYVSFNPASSIHL